MMPAERVLLVTGAFGGLASRLLRVLAEEPETRVIAIGRDSSAIPALPHRVELVLGDLRRADVWANLPRTITHVFHLAAAIPWRREQKAHASVVSDNLEPIAHLLEQMHLWPKLEQIVYASSVSVYGWTSDVLNEESPTRPADLYGAAKLAGEDLLLAAQARSIRVAALRFGSLYGRGQFQGTVIPAMLRAAKQEGRIFVFGEGRRSQDFLHYDDAAEAALLAFRRGVAGAFNIGSGHAITMTELAALIREVVGAERVEIVHDRQTTEGDPGFRIDIRKAARELSFQPRRELRQSLAQLHRETERGS